MFTNSHPPVQDFLHPLYLGYNYGEIPDSWNVTH